MYKIVLLLLVFVTGSLSQIQIIGECPITNGSQATDNWTSIGGKWYQIERIPNSEESGDCSTSTFLGILVDTITNREVVGSRERERRGAIAFRPREQHKFVVQFSDTILPKDHYLIATDFRNYALIGRCDEYYHNATFTTTTLYAWKWSRTNALTEKSNAAINRHLATIPELANAEWRLTRHTYEACQTINGGNGAGSVVSSLFMVLIAVFLAAKENF